MRLVVLAQFDPNGGLPGHVALHLKGLRPIADRLVLVSNSPLSDQAMAKAKRLADLVVMRPNRGFDFAGWRDVLAMEDASRFDWVVLTNSSIVGPIFPLVPVMTRMEARGGDFWGMVRSEAPDPHLQSVFLAFSRRVTGSAAWRDFWASVEDHDDKQQVIDQYERPLMAHLEAAGFRADAVMSRAIIGYPRIHGIRRLRPRVRWLNRMNKMVFAPTQAVLRGVPYLKVSLWPDRAPLLPQLLYRSFPWSETGL